MPEDLKEPHYFAGDLHYLLPTHPGLRWTVDRESYFQLFKDSANHRAVGEASVMYLFSQCAAQQIHDFNPESKIIIQLRNPVDMVDSFFFLLRLVHIETHESLEEAFAFEKEVALSSPRQCRSPFRYREIALYENQVRRFFDIFPREQILVILYDDFKADTESVYTQACRLLGVSTSFKPKLQVINNSKKWRSTAIEKLLRNPPIHRKTLRTLWKISLPRTFRIKLRKLAIRANRKGFQRPELREGFKLELTRHFQSDIEGLSKLINKDLSHW